MAKLTDVLIGVGLTANDKTGDSLRAAFQKVNVGFTDLYTKLGLVDGSGLNLGAFEFAGSTLSTTDSTAIVIDQATTITSDLTVGGDIVAGDQIVFGTAKLRITNDGAIYVNDLLAATPGGSPTWSSITGKPTFATVATSGAYADLSGRPTDLNQFTDTTGILSSTLVYIGTTPPAGPVNGRLWYDTVSGRMYIYYSGAWVDANP
jgi:hypothetical protein